MIKHKNAASEAGIYKQVVEQIQTILEGASGCESQKYIIKLGGKTQT